MTLSEVKSSLERYHQELQLVLSDISDSQLLLPEKPSKWSINQVMEHLLLANTSYLEQLKKTSVSAPTESHPEIEIRKTVTGKLFRWFVDVRVPFKVPAPGIFQPDRKQPREVLKAEFLAFQEDLIRVCGELENKPFNSIKVNSPLSSLISFNAGEVLAIISEHQFRHLGQIRRIKGVVVLD